MCVTASMWQVERCGTVSPNCRKYQAFPWRRIVLRLGIAAALILSAASYGISKWWYRPWNAPGTTPQGPRVPTETSLAGFEWLEVRASADLKFHSCYGKFKCARLEVPMDWQRTKNGNKVQIAIIKLPAKVPVTDPGYGGAILMGYGGPGEPGVQALQEEGERVQSAVDAIEDLNESDSRSNYYDILAFDPRGVMHSTPLLNCIPDDFQRGLWRWQSKTEDDISSSNQTFRDKWAKWKAFGTTCTDLAKNQGKGSIAYHMNTTPVVADMIEIIERHGQWRDAEARRAVFGCPHRSSIFSGFRKRLTPEQRAILERTKWRKGYEQIMFWGLSYGTILGQTFASMYPERINRFVLDGVSVAADHYTGQKLSNLQNTDKSFDMFFQYCYEAGPERCPLWFGNSRYIQSAEDIKSIVTTFSNFLRSTPMPVPGSKDLGPTTITYSDYKNLVRESMYYPITGFPLIAKLLSQMIHGDGREFALYKLGGQDMLYQPQCPKSHKYSSPFGDKVVEPREETFAGIQCTDFPSLVSESREVFKAYLNKLHGQSEIAGGFWAELRMRCIGWDIRPSWSYRGPFTTNTSFPMLIIGNTYDPVTPIQNNYVVQKNFPGSAVLEQRSVGHTFPTIASSCTNSIIRRYFQSGELPPDGTICDPSETPFMDAPSG